MRSAREAQLLLSRKTECGLALAWNNMSLQIRFRQNMPLRTPHISHECRSVAGPMGVAASLPLPGKWDRMKACGFGGVASHMHEVCHE
jgi:hypothetical protein